jgi:hypothetical protein
MMTTPPLRRHWKPHTTIRATMCCTLFTTNEDLLGFDILDHTVANSDISTSPELEFHVEGHSWSNAPQFSLFYNASWLKFSLFYNASWLKFSLQLLCSFVSILLRGRFSLSLIALPLLPLSIDKTTNSLRSIFESFNMALPTSFHRAIKIDLVHLLFPQA